VAYVPLEVTMHKSQTYVNVTQKHRVNTAYSLQSVQRHVRHFGRDTTDTNLNTEVKLKLLKQCTMSPEYT